MARSRCIVCSVDFSVDEGSSRPLVVSPEKVFEILCEYFPSCANDENDLWRLKEDNSVSFCPTCQEIGSELYFLQTQLESTQSKILKIISQVSSTILETTSLQPENLNLDQIIARKVFRFQSLVKKQYNPQLVLTDCSTVLDAKRRLRDKKIDKILKEVDETPTILHDDDDVLQLSTRPISISFVESLMNDIDSDLSSHEIDIKEELDDDDMDQVIHLNTDSWDDNTTIEEQQQQDQDDEEEENSDMEWINSNDDMSLTGDGDDIDDNSANFDEEPEAKTSKKNDSNSSSGSSSKRTSMEDEDGKVEYKPKSEKVGDGQYLYDGKYGFVKVGTGVQCQSCGLKLKFRTHIYRHIKEIHMGLLPSKFQCSICQKKLGSLKVFLSHLSKLHPDTEVKGQIIHCGENKFLFNGKWFFQKTTDEGKFTCGTCGDDQSTSQNQIIKHFQDHHQDQYTCDECHKRFPSKRSLTGHQNNTHKSQKKPRQSSSVKSGNGPVEVNQIVKDQQVPQTPLKQNMHKTDRLKSEKVGDGRYLYDGKFGYVKTSPRSCTCETCGLKMNLTHIHRHIRFKHMGLVPTKFSCSTCGKSLSNLKNFLKHQSLFHPTTDLLSQVIVCGDGKFLIEGRWLFEKTEGGLKCQSCGHLCDSQDISIEHVHTFHHVVNYKCEECSLEFDTNRALLSHKSTHDASKKRKLGVSSTISQNSEQQFVYRGVWKFEQVEGGYKCLTCGIFFISRNGMQNHLKHNHADPTPDNGIYLYDSKWPFEKVDKGFRCGTCGAIRKLKGCMDQHIKERHVDPKRHVCEKCGKAFGSKQSFEYHQAKHSDLTPFMCDECGSRFRNKDELRQHKLSHKSWECSECGKLFEGKFGKSNMFHHKKRAHSTKSIACFKCTKTFLYKSELTQHLTTHR